MVELARRTPSTLREFMDRVDNFVNIEDTLIALTTQSEQNEERVSKGGQKRDQDGGQKAWRGQHKERRHNDSYVHYSSVHSHDKAKEAKHGKDHGRQSQKYCTYHNMSGHKTEDCHILKHKIEDMRNNGKLVRMVAQNATSPQTTGSQSISPNGVKA